MATTIINKISNKHFRELDSSISESDSGDTISISNNGLKEDNQVSFNDYQDYCSYDRLLDSPRNLKNNNFDDNNDLKGSLPELATNLKDLNKLLEPASGNSFTSTDYENSGVFKNGNFQNYSPSNDYSPNNEYSSNNTMVNSYYCDPAETEACVLSPLQRNILSPKANSDVSNQESPDILTDEETTFNNFKVQKQRDSDVSDAPTIRNSAEELDLKNGFEEPAVEHKVETSKPKENDKDIVMETTNILDDATENNLSIDERRASVAKIRIEPPEAQHATGEMHGPLFSDEDREMDDDYHPFDDLDEATIRNTKLNAAVNGIPRSTSPEIKKNNGKSVTFSTQIQEHLGAYEGEDGEREYGPTQTVLREFSEVANDPDKPIIKSRMSSLSTEDTKSGKLQKSIKSPGGSRPISESRIRSSTPPPTLGKAKKSTSKSIGTSPITSSIDNKVSENTTNIPIGTVISPTPTPKTKKVRHVQIQTRLPQMKDVNIQCNLSNNQVKKFEESHKLQVAKIESLNNSNKKMNDLINENDAKTAEMMKEIESLKETVSRLRNEKKQLIKTQEEEQMKFSHLSSQAYRKIKDLMTERQVSSIHIKALQEQLHQMDTKFME